MRPYFECKFILSDKLKTTSVGITPIGFFLTDKKKHLTDVILIPWAAINTTTKIICRVETAAYIVCWKTWLRLTIIFIIN